MNKCFKNNWPFLKNTDSFSRTLLLITHYSLVIIQETVQFFPNRLLKKENAVSLYCMRCFAIVPARRTATLEPLVFSTRTQTTTWPGPRCFGAKNTYHPSLMRSPFRMRSGV